MATQGAGMSEAKVLRRGVAPLRGEELRRAVRDVVARHSELGQCRAFLFGSEASGSARPDSDIDVGLLAREPLPLAALGAVRAELEELPTLRAFDVVDLSRVDEEFRDQALRHAVPLDG